MDPMQAVQPRICAPKSCEWIHSSLSPYAVAMATEAVLLKKSGAASQRIADELSQRILDGDLAPGTRIRQEQIAEEFGVSRLPIREALRILESHGLVTLVASSGAWVSSMNLAECQETYLIRERH